MDHMMTKKVSSSLALSYGFVSMTSFDTAVASKHWLSCYFFSYFDGNASSIEHRNFGSTSVSTESLNLVLGERLILIPIINLQYQTSRIL